MLCTSTHLRLVYLHVVSTNIPINIHKACNPNQSFKHLNFIVKRWDICTHMIQALFLHVFFLLPIISLYHYGIMPLMLDRHLGIWNILNQTISIALFILFGLLHSANILLGEPPPWWITRSTLVYY